MNGILMALFGTLGTFLITALGAAGIFFVRREVSGNLQCGFLGFAGGVMIAASVWSLLLPGIDFAEANGQVGWLVMTGGFLLGVITLLVADGLMKAWYEREKSTQLTLGKSTAMLIIAITTHNIPEGMAVGVTFAGVLSDNVLITMTGAFVLSAGIAIQNFPEGAIISMPLRAQGITKRRAFVYGTLSGIVEPIAAFLTIWLTGFVVPLLPYFLSFAAGAMIYVVVEELIPEAQNGKHTNVGTIGVAAGFTLMMILDVALG